MRETRREGQSEIRREDQPGLLSNPSDEEGCPEDQLLSLVQQTIATMNQAVCVARQLGPEWEDGVDGVREPLVEQLSELVLRIQSLRSHRRGE